MSLQWKVRIENMNNYNVPPLRFIAWFVQRTFSIGIVSIQRNREEHMEIKRHSVLLDETRELLILLLYVNLIAFVLRFFYEFDQC